MVYWQHTVSQDYLASKNNQLSMDEIICLCKMSFNISYTEPLLLTTQWFTPTHFHAAATLKLVKLRKAAPGSSYIISPRCRVHSKTYSVICLLNSFFFFLNILAFPQPEYNLSEHALCGISCEMMLNSFLGSGHTMFTFDIISGFKMSSLFD